jgi:hypothetical protein
MFFQKFVATVRSFIPCGLLSLLMLGWTGYCGGATYHVDPCSTNENGTGTAEAPRKSLEGLLGELKSGDTVILRSGRYGPVTFNSVPSDFITFKAAPKAAAVFDKLTARNSSYGRFVGLIIQGGVNAYGSKHFELIDCDVTFKGDRYSSPANLVDIRHTSDALVKHCIICNGSTGLKADVSQNVIISGNLFHNLADDGINATPVKHLLFELNHMYDLNQDRLVLKDYWTTLGFIAPSAAVRVIDRPHSDINISVDPNAEGPVALVQLAKPTNFANINSMGMFIKTASGYDRGELSVRISEGAAGEPNAHSVDILLFACGPDIRGDKFINDLPKELMDIHAARSITLLRKKTGADAIKIIDWDFSNGAHQDYVVISGSDIVIRNNIFHNGASQGIFTSPAKAYNVVIENNLIYDLGGSNLTHLTIGGKCIIRNNTFIGALRNNYESQLHSPSHFLGIVRVAPLDDGNGITIINNVVAGELSAEGGRNDHNIVQYQSKYGPHTLTLGGQRASTHAFDHGFFVRPDLSRKNGRFSDYMLTPASPAVNFGSAADQPADSLGVIDSAGFIESGSARDPNHHCAGAYELSRTVSDASHTGP